MGEYAVAKAPMRFVKTMALGSCVAVIGLDASHKAAGILHVALPHSAINKNRAVERPGMFVDTGIPCFLEEMKRFGHDDDNRLIVKLAGGASIMDSNSTFNIGKRNVLAIRKYLWQHGLGAIREDIGGVISRSVDIDLASGEVLVSSPGRGEWVL
jgi:chemotaxis protein CheD